MNTNPRGAYIALFSLNALALAFTGAMTGQNWADLSGTSRALVIAIIIGNWTNTLLALWHQPKPVEAAPVTPPTADTVNPPASPSLTGPGKNTSLNPQGAALQEGGQQTTSTADSPPAPAVGGEPAGGPTLGSP